VRDYLDGFGGHFPLGLSCLQCSVDVGNSSFPTSSQWVGSPTSVQGGVPSTFNDTISLNLPKPLYCLSWQKGWLGVPCRLPKTSLFNAYTISYKGFKSRFIKIKVIDGGLFYTDSRPLPLYWREPLKFKGLLKSQLSLEARVDLLFSWLGLVPILLTIFCFRLADMLKKQGFNMEELIKRSKLTNKARSTLATSKEITDVGVEVAPIGVEKTSATTGSQKGSAPPDSNVAKRKVEAARKKGKTIVPSQLAPAPPRQKGKVIVTSGPELPPGATLEVWRGWAKRVEQILVKEAINKKEFEKAQVEAPKLKDENQKAKAKVERLKAELATIKSKVASIKTTSKAEVAKLKTALATTQKTSHITSKDLSVARSRVVEVEAILASDKETKVKLGATLEVVEGKLKDIEVRRESKAAKAKEELQDLVAKVECLEWVILEQHEGGFNKALRQIALLAPDFDLSPYDITKEVKDEKLVSL
ncbi:hypothetical protein CR513_03234, partial [Mucuna pruriens]